MVSPMALSHAIEEARRRRGRPAGDRSQRFAEARVDERITIDQYDGLFSRWDAADRKGDLRLESGFQRMYAHLKAQGDTDGLDLIADLYQWWLADERAEERVVDATKDHKAFQLTQHRANNDLFLGDGCGPTGRAA